LTDEVTANSSIVVRDAKGMVVMQQRFTRNPQSVDVSKLSKGVYMVIMNNNGTITTGKFIKQ
jgi:hypothetical protein